MCNHAIGFCTILDDLVYYNYPETTKIEFLSEKCPNNNRDLIFDYCPFCGEDLKYLILNKGRKIKVEIDVPDLWVGEELNNIRKDIIQKWAIVKYFTGHKAEHWVIKNSIDSIDGRIEFYEAVRAVEDSILSILKRKS